MSTLSDYLEIKRKADTANEMNESSQAVYRQDLVYLFFKVLLFVILGLFFKYFKPENKVLA